MASLPRIITVDPTGVIARIVRTAVDLADRPAVQIDIPSPEEAYDEILRSGCQLLITAMRLTNGISGIELASEVRKVQPDTAVILLADIDDPDEVSLDGLEGTQFLFVHRPVDPAEFMRVFIAGLEGKDILLASMPPARTLETNQDLGTVPALDVKAARVIVDELLVDVGAMAIILATRAGDILLELGAVGYLDRVQLTGSLLPTIRTTVEVGHLIGGQPSAFQFYDGDRFDVFVLSVGFHHFMCLVYDGQIGSRQFGAVNRFGRRAAEDLIALLGMSAFTIAPSAADEAPRRRPKHAEAPAPVEIEEPIARAEEWAAAPEPAPLPEPEVLRLEPIADLDFSLFDQQTLDLLDSAAADDLFDPAKLAEIASETRRERGPLTYDEARELGIIP